MTLELTRARDALLRQLQVELEQLDREDARDVPWGTRAARKVAAIADDVREAFGIPRAVPALEDAADDIREVYGPRVVDATDAADAERISRRTVHALKCWPRFFAALADGSKTFEFRDASDRTFEVGDLLQLYEWDPRCKAGGVLETTYLPGATGRELFLEVLGVSILAGQVRFDSDDDGPSLTLAGRLAVLSVRLVPPFPPELPE